MRKNIFMSQANLFLGSANVNRSKISELRKYRSKSL